MRSVGILLVTGAATVSVLVGSIGNAQGATQQANWADFRPAAPVPSATLQAVPSLPSNLGTFNIVIVPGAGLASNAPALAAFNRAALAWSSRISDPITVTINADLTTTQPGGGTFPGN